MKISFRLIALFFCLFISFADLHAQRRPQPDWKALPIAKPEGAQEENIKCYTLNPKLSNWKQPAFVYNHDIATKPVKSKVIVLVYNPILKTKGNVSLISYLKSMQPQSFFRHPG